MSKQTKAKKRQKLKQLQNSQSKFSLVKKLIGFSCNVYALAFGLLTWFATSMPFVSRINISPTQTFDPKTPFSARFEIQNNGMFSVYDVQLSDEANGQVGPMGIGKGINNEFPSLTPAEFQLDPATIHSIAPGQKPATWMTVTIINTPTVDGDKLEVTISVKYRPKFVWWHNTVKQKFATVRNPNGEFGWIEVPIDE